MVPSHHRLGTNDRDQLTGVEVHRIHVDRGYRGHSYENKFRVWISGQVRRVTKTIRREMKRRAAIEPVIGHVKAEHRMERNYLKGRRDCANAVLAAAGYNFRLLLRWLEALLPALFAESSLPDPSHKPPEFLNRRIVHRRLVYVGAESAFYRFEISAMGVTRYPSRLRL